MLISRGRWEIAEHTVNSVLVLGRACRAQLVHRTGLLFDTRYLRSGIRERDVVTLYLVGAGESRASSGLAQQGPCVWVLAEDEFERARGAGLTLRSWGEPALVMDLCVPRAQVCVDVGLTHGPRPLSADAVAAMKAMLAADDEPTTRGAFVALVGSLRASSYITPETEQSLEETEPAQLQRLWEALRVPYERHDTGAYLELLAGFLKLSPRQVQRDLGELAQRFGLDGFRGVLKTLRLRRAVLLLSAEHLTVRQVAEVVGYGSTDAMARAFRDASLPTPSALRAEVRHPGIER